MIVHSPYGRRVHEPWAMAITTRIKQRYGFDGQVYAADDGIIIRLPDGDGNLPIRELLLFDTEELQRIIETQVGESVLYAARSENARRDRCSCHAPTPADASPCGSSGCARRNCSTPPELGRTSRCCWKPHANAYRTCTICPR